MCRSRGEQSNRNKEIFGDVHESKGDGCVAQIRVPTILACDSIEILIYQILINNINILKFMKGCNQPHPTRIQSQPQLPLFFPLPCLIFLSPNPPRAQPSTPFPPKSSISTQLKLFRMTSTAGQKITITDQKGNLQGTSINQQEKGCKRVGDDSEELYGLRSYEIIILIQNDLMKVEDNISLKLSLRARLRLSRNLVDSAGKTSKQKLQLSKLSKRSSHIKKIIDRVIYATKERMRKSQNKKIHHTNMKTRSRAKKDLDSHPFRKLVSRNVDVKTFKKFLKDAYEGAVYSTKHLEPMELSATVKETVQIQEAGGRKILILDLDETLIHSVQKTEVCQITLPDNNGSDIRMNVRPYVPEFLKNMSQHYEIYVFTASTKSYAEPILLHLDPSSTLIKGLLCRPSCVLTTQGCYIKDLRVFSEQLNKVVIIDNYVHSFGLQMSNGIPILPFQNNVLDEELKYVQELLLKLKDTEDVRPHLNEMFQLKKLAEMKKRDLNL